MDTNLEKKVEHLEDMLARTLNLLDLLIHLDSGINKEDADWLLRDLMEIQHLEV